MTTVYFVRHGQSVANIHHFFAGSQDSPLTEQGEQQAVLTGHFLKEVPFTAVYASDLQRAYRTGQAVAVHHSLSVSAVTALREIFAGEWEGKGFDTLMLRADYRVWLDTIGLAQPAGGESVAALQQRVKIAVEDIVHHHPGETVCIATHATPIRVMECLWRGVPLAKMHTIPWVSNSSVTVATYDEQGVGHLVKRDICDHLGDMKTQFPSNV